MVSDIRLTGSTVDLVGAKVRLRETSNGDETIELDTGKGKIHAGAGGQHGGLDLLDQEGNPIVLFSASDARGTGTERARFNGSTGNLFLGGGGVDGDLVLTNNAGENRVWLSGGAQPKPQDARVYLDGGRAQIELGGQGADGDVVLRRTDGKLAIGLNAETAAAHFGAEGQDGDVLVYNNTYTKTIHLDGASGTVEAKSISAQNMELKGEATVRGTLTLRNDQGAQAAELLTENGEAKLRFSGSDSFLSRTGLRVEQRLPDTAATTAAKPAVFFGDMQWAKAIARQSGNDPEEGLRAQINTQGLCRLGGNGVGGTLEVTKSDGSAGLTVSEDRMNFHNRFSVTPEGSIELSNGGLSITSLTTNDPSGITMDRGGIRLRSERSNPTGSYITLQDETGFATITMTGQSGKIAAQDISLPSIQSLLDKIRDLEARIAKLEARA